MSEAEQTIARIKAHDNVGFLIVNKGNEIIRTNYLSDEKVQHVS